LIIYTFCREREALDQKTLENVCSYDKTWGFLGLDGFVCIKSATNEKSMKLGRKGMSLGTLLAIVVADGRILLTVWIFAEKGKKPTYMTTFQTRKRFF
jgi:hypothetical protein